MKDARQAIEQTNAATQSIGQSRKAIAAEMVRRIKDQLRIMMSMMAGMDPKTKARMIAKMASELAAAVREYAAASGGSAQGNVAATADGTIAQNDNGAASGGEHSAMAGAATSETSPNMDSEAGTESPAEATGAPPEISGPVRGKLEEYSQHAGSPDAKADQEFVMEVRKLAAMLKALAKQNAMHARKEPDPSTVRDTAAIDDALNEVERSLADIASAADATTITLSIVAK